MPRLSLTPTIKSLLTTRATSNATVTGWIKSIRRQKRVSFAVISDGTTTSGLQAVFRDADVHGLTNGASVRLTGQLQDSPGAGQEKELIVDNVEVLGACDPETYPIQKQTLSNEYLRDNIHLRARTGQIAEMLRLRHALQRNLSAHFEDEGFIHVNTPLITSNDAEGAGETFKLANSEEFFLRPAFLTVSAQLHLEAIQSAISRVWTLSPAFRAEKSDTNRHLSEFWMLEAEWGVSDVQELCRFVENLLKSSIKGSSPASWPIITYTEAIETLSSSSHSFDFTPKWGSSLASEHEKYLAKDGPIFVTDYPSELKPFYMRANSDDRTVACFDLLVPGIGELAGGSIREEREDVLARRMNQFGMKEGYEWYLDLRRFGGSPHGGFGMGFERLVSWVGGIENVKECVPMPRWAGRLVL